MPYALTVPETDYREEPETLGSRIVGVYIIRIRPDMVVYKLLVIEEDTCDR